MDSSIITLCEAIKKLRLQLNSSGCALSFILVVGKKNQGQTTLLKQATLKSYPLISETGANLFYNNSGIVLELSEQWINARINKLAACFRKLNRCHSSLKISGLIVCVDSSELLLTEPLELSECCQLHCQYLDRVCRALPYAIDVNLFITKLDMLAGFCEFFQTEHTSELQKPLGFSLSVLPDRRLVAANFHHKLNQMIEMLGQNLINKLHPARSSTKRTLIREFPLQLETLRLPIQTLIKRLSSPNIRLQSVFFVSAQQGGISIDSLNKKIQHEYALVVQNKYPQSNNYRSYFIDGAVQAVQAQTTVIGRTNLSLTQKIKLGAAGLSVSALLILLGYQHIHTSQLLDDASKELLAYETLVQQNKDNNTALYHLFLAENKLNAIHIRGFSLPLLEKIKLQLHQSTEEKLNHYFLPNLVQQIEGILASPSQTPLARYEALKVYLMLSEPEHFSEAEIMRWFTHFQQQYNPNSLDDKPRVVLKTALRQPFQFISINKQLVTDVRNYLNALPPAYLYYSLAKGYFPSGKTTITIEGFDLASRELPYYVTKSGFQEVTKHITPISNTLQQENWVLARQDLNDLNQQLSEAYYYDYVNWWKNFISRTQPQHYQGNQQARQLIQQLVQKRSIGRLLELIQQNTKPEPSENSELFNQKIASNFTTVNFMTLSASQEFTENLAELEQFLTTLMLVQDNGKTLFNLTRARFSGDSTNDPLSKLYNRSHQLPHPVSAWAKQIADDSWYIFISNSKQFINRQWQADVFQVYQQTIANRYPMDNYQKDEITIADFNHFFAPSGVLNSFINNYLKDFLDTKQPQWVAKEQDGYIMPMSNELLDELIRANVISNMFFPKGNSTSIDFSLQKISLDPVVASLQLSLGGTELTDNQATDSFTFFKWPGADAKLSLTSIEGSHFELEEKGVWAFFKMLQKVNVLVDNNDSSSLQILFEVNGNSGRYVLKTENQINPFSPGILTGFTLTPVIA